MYSEESSRTILLGFKRKTPGQQVVNIGSDLEEKDEREKQRRHVIDVKSAQRSYSRQAVTV